MIGGEPRRRGSGNRSCEKRVFFNDNFIVFHLLYNPKLVPRTGTLQFSVICQNIYGDLAVIHREKAWVY